MFNAEINIRNAAKGLDNQEFLTKIGTYDFGFDLDLQALKAQEHHQCNKKHLNKFCLECCQKEGSSEKRRENQTGCI